MTDARAFEEVKAAKATLDRHWNNGFLSGFWYVQDEGFRYSCWDGRYEVIAGYEEDAA